MLREDPIVYEKKRLISEHNQKSRGIYTQLKDGQVPSFNEFQKIKGQILKDNQDKEGVTPLS